MATGLEISKILLSYFPQGFVGTIVEVGAGHPTDLSITTHFRALNWKVITVEPNPEFCEEYRRNDIPVLEYAVCSEDIGQTSFKISPNAVSCSALEVRYLVQKKGMGWADEDFKTISIQALTLNTILKTHHPEVNRIDILIVDTEGWEIDVLEGFDIIKFSPEVLCIENFQNLDSHREYILKKRYTKVRTEEQDEIYIKQL